MLNQADATAWMAFYCGHMLQIALELAEDSVAYADMASKFLEHYMAIATRPMRCMALDYGMMKMDFTMTIFCRAALPRRSRCDR